jgi:hypothetical protein
MDLRPVISIRFAFTHLLPAEAVVHAEVVLVSSPFSSLTENSQSHAPLFSVFLRRVAEKVRVAFFAIIFLSSPRSTAGLLVHLGSVFYSMSGFS